SLTVERTGPEAAALDAVVHDGDEGRGDLLALPAGEERPLLDHVQSVECAEETSHEGARRLGLEDDRYLGRRDRLGSQPRERALGRLSPDPLGRIQVQEDPLPIGVRPLALLVAVRRHGRAGEPGGGGPEYLVRDEGIREMNLADR